jgi:hypothetical protein
VDALTFISKLLENGLWPAAAVVIVIYIIRNMDRISSTVSKVKVKDVEVDFREKIADVKQAANDQALTILYPRAANVLPQVSLAESRPQAFLVELTSDIENALLEWEKKQGKTGARAPMDILRELADRKLIGDDVLTPASQLFEIRNQYVHSENISLTSGEAMELVGIARSVRERLRLRLGA